MCKPIFEFAVGQLRTKLESSIGAGQPVTGSFAGGSRQVGEYKSATRALGLCVEWRERSSAVPLDKDETHLKMSPSSSL